jgi:alpha-glucosidase (family GH31 glycosyl hydrolase)
VHYARTFGDLLCSAGKAPVTFSRAGFTGSQAHGVFWAGDEDSTWAAFRNSITAGVTAASCGIVYWGWDLAGFSGPVPDPELYLRAAGASVFMPIMQYHSEFNHHRRPLRDCAPWHVAETTGDDRVVPVFRAFAQLRERLVGYLAEQARVAVTTDRPVMRPLFFDQGDQAEVWQYPRQYLLGDDLLAAGDRAGGDGVCDLSAAGRVRGRLLRRRGVRRTGCAPSGTDRRAPSLLRAERWPDPVDVFRP